MARIAGVDIPRDKRVVISLTYVYGIGKSTAKEILKATGISEDVRVKDLTEEEITKIRKEVEKIKVEGDLRREVQLNIKWKSEATEVCVTVKDFLFVVKKLKLMLELVRVKQDQSQERKNNRRLKGNG